MSQATASDPGAIQDAQYQFPYHYLPRVEGGRFRFHEVLSWGHEYLAYMTHVADLVETLEWNSLLDVGCGDGRLVAILSERFGNRRVVGLDYSERAIALARALVPAASFVSGDVTRPDLFAERFDLATCIDVLEHIEPGFLPEFVAGMRGQVRDGGRLIVTVPSTNVKLNKKHYQHFTDAKVRETLAPAFEVQDCYYINGDSRPLQAMRMALTNRLYTVTHPALLTAFYRFYVRGFLRSDPKRGARVLAICRAV
ncbi:MAG TPA: class I SAM-dependent methyltransferase [Allosphingosinicella sp.]|jgi:SAM-dependent methyltransferase